jgi:hypothetical protein
VKYFTPELFVESNSEDKKVAKQASRRWDRAVDDYARYLKSINRRLPAKVRQLARLNLHDATLENLSFDRSPDQELAQLTLRQRDRAAGLLYFLIEPPTMTQAIDRFPFCPSPIYWLYDEVSIDGPGDFSHEILFSDGRELHLRFKYLALLTVLTNGEASRHSAQQTPLIA